MKIRNRFIAFVLSIAACVSLFVVPACAVQPRWTNANFITLAPAPDYDEYLVQVQAVEGTTKIEITATLKEKNIFGVYVDKDTESGTFYSETARLVGTYDMNPNKDYKVTAVVYVTANGYREKIEV